MTQRSKTQIIDSVKAAIQDASPQLRVDVDKGPFYYLAAQGVAQPLSEVSADVERLALLSTLQFPSVATDQEAMAVARAFGMTLGSGGYASGVAMAYTGRRPTGTDVLTVPEGSRFTTSSNRGIAFEAVESRSLTANNADIFYNPATRRFELPVRVQAVSAGVNSNISARTLVSVEGSLGFDGSTNLAAFRGGSEPQTVRALYDRVRQRLAGLDNFSRGGLVSRIQNLDVDRIQAVSLTYSTEYPYIFYRTPDTQAVDAWVLNTAQDDTEIETFIATSGQTIFYLNKGPVLYLSAVLVNGSPVSATLVQDTSFELGRSTKEHSYVTLAAPTLVSDVVEVTYGYDTVLNTIQADIDGYLSSDTGALFATDVLIRYPRTVPLTAQITGTVLGSFDPTSVEAEVAAVFGQYLTNGIEADAHIGGFRSPADLRDMIRSQVPGISALSIPTFCRKSVGSLVETIDIPRNAYAVLETAADLTTSFT